MKRFDEIILYIDFRGHGKGMTSISVTKGEQRLFSLVPTNQR